MQRKAGRAPSGHLSRLKPVEQDPLAEYGLPSKGEKRLLSPKVQESYYAQIAARYLAFCTAAGDRDNLQRQFARLSLTSTTSTSTSTTPSLSQSPIPTPLPPPSLSQHHHHPPQPPLPRKPETAQSQSQPTAQNQNRSKEEDPLPQILAALRKLREGLVASHRRDHFAAQVYLFSARLGILAGAYETYYPALLHLLRWGRGGHSPAHGPGPTNEFGVGAGTGKEGVGGGASASPLTTLEHHEVVSHLILDSACRRGDLAAAYALRSRHGLRDAKVDGVLRALVGDNWVVWRRIKKQVDGYRARLMEFAEARVTGHTLKAFGRAYLSVPVGVLEEQAGCEWGELKGRYQVGWEVDGGRVVIRKVQGR
ncbi:hypothetical protein C8A01DRAFT_14852 [Parachaetomium inaequale]|uniref:Uncharacterized protein n=1 Tax=Parachaetomium inaequale TaxID=2588326 RepID=A0AAN6SSY5_9PEZI|nr:hypothetical protein C8A01DRAFT_14852 [Parachaetomium inaequale]